MLLPYVFRYIYTYTMYMYIFTHYTFVVGNICNSILLTIVVFPSRIDRMFVRPNYVWVPTFGIYLKNKLSFMGV